MLMATETIKLILGVGKPLIGRLALYDSLKMSFKDVKIRKDPHCELCGETPSVTELIDYVAFCNVQMPLSKSQEIDPAQVEISPGELKKILDGGKPITLLDVRESFEWEIAHIEQARLAPLSQLDKHIHDLSPDEDIYLYCYKGKRSLTALKKLREHGFTKLKSLAGGIDHWAEEVDPDMPRY